MIFFSLINELALSGSAALAGEGLGLEFAF